VIFGKIMINFLFLVNFGEVCANCICVEKNASFLCSFNMNEKILFVKKIILRLLKAFK